MAPNAVSSKEISAHLESTLLDEQRALTVQNIRETYKVSGQTSKHDDKPNAELAVVLCQKALNNKEMHISIYSGQKQQASAPGYLRLPQTIEPYALIPQGGYHAFSASLVNNPLTAKQASKVTQVLQRRPPIRLVSLSLPTDTSPAGESILVLSGETQTTQKDIAERADHTSRSSVRSLHMEATQSNLSETAPKARTAFFGGKSSSASANRQSIANAANVSSARSKTGKPLQPASSAIDKLQKAQGNALKRMFSLASSSPSSSLQSKKIDDTAEEPLKKKISPTKEKYSEAKSVKVLNPGGVSSKTEEDRDDEHEFEFEPDNQSPLSSHSHLSRKQSSDDDKPSPIGHAENIDPTATSTLPPPDSQRRVMKTRVKMDELGNFVTETYWEEAEHQQAQMSKNLIEQESPQKASNDNSRAALATSSKIGVPSTAATHKPRNSATSTSSSTANRKKKKPDSANQTTMMSFFTRK